MASALMEAEEPSIVMDNARIVGLESQILNSQEIIVRLNRELDSALLRIATLENVCSENQNDLHEKRNRINDLIDEIDEREEMNERLKQELYEKDEKLKTLDNIIIQLKQHIKQENIDKEQRQTHENIHCQQCQFLLNEFGKTTENFSINNLHSQIMFDRQLCQLILHDLGNNNNNNNYDYSLNNSPQEILDQYHKQERLKFHDLLQKSLITEDISNLIDSDDILFELLTHLNSLIRLKETLSNDSKELQHIRSLLHLTTDDDNNNNNDEFIQDLINKRECIKYLRTKIDNNHNFTDYELIKHVLHDYFNFQQQQIEIKEYLHLNIDNNNNDNALNYSRLLIERCSEAIHVGVELNERIKNYEQTIVKLSNQLDEHINKILERRKQIDEIVSKFYNTSIDQDTNEVTQLDRIRSILQSDVDFRRALASETLVTSNEDILQRIREYKSVYENHQILTEKYSNENQHLIIDELTKQIHELKEEGNQRKNQLKEISLFLESNTDNEEIQFNLIHSFLQSSNNFCLTLSNKLSVTNNHESILQRIHDYQLIINQLIDYENHWTNETTDELITKLKTMKNAENIVEDLQKQLNESIHNEKQLQNNIKEITDRFVSNIDHNEGSNITYIHHLLESLTNFRQKLVDKTQMNTDEDILNLFQKYQENNIQLQELLNQSIQEKQDVELQTTNNDDNFYNQVKELIDVEIDNPEEIINKIKELSQLPSPALIDELLFNNEQLRNLLNIEDENLVQSVMKLNENFYQLKEQYEKLIQKENVINKHFEQMMNKLGLSSDSSLQTQIDEICVIFDTFSIEYNQLTSTNIKTMNLIEIFKHIQLVLIENNQLKNLIDQLDFDKSSDNLDYISKLQNYLRKVDNLCRLICNDDNINIDQALIMYQRKIEHDEDIIEKISNFKQQLLTRLSIDNEEKIFDRLSEIEKMNTDLKDKLQNHNDTNSTLTSLNITISEQRNQILEKEETLEKLRTQRERMLSKMKEMKTNNETLTNQFKQTNQSLDEFHLKEIDYKNQIEEIKQQLRSGNNQIQVTLDECQAQQELQETMKLEIESIKNEMDTQRKLYESRCRQIMHEKNQLDKNQKELFEQKQILENENKRLQTILYTIKDTLENVDDINLIVDTILKLRQDHLIFTNQLTQRNEYMHIENEKLLLNINQQQSIINEYIQTKNELEKRLFDNEQQIMNLKQELNNQINQYQHLQNEYQLYKEEYSTKINSQVAIIDIEQSSPPQPHHLPIQQAAESNHWMAIDMKDEEIPLATATKHSTINTPTALLNLLGELKSKLGITLTHRPRLSSVYFLYLCSVHLLTIYLLFIRHC
ncbi:unnamed protein product [Rotaria sordida]|uniref:Uncharacterized protein n=1 Tax=Rotaria sordida TaxID=392033 RepID=A0A814S066_9BILA|nr:unnamed protein product [Rotaria sordida]